MLRILPQNEPSRTEIGIDMILLPWGSGRETDDAAVQAVRENSALAPAALTAETGEIVPDPYLPTVRCENNEAVFTLSGGKNNVAVTVEGFASVKPPRIETLRGGVWMPYEVASAHGYDGYGVRPDAGGAYAFSFIVPMEREAHTFRVWQEG